ncbi:MAG TPA: AraC family transcriptional regulator [Epulopiscium sp.]|nr:AraC family transcriptional regulator [Candidatus Epulonipiscium sp.]
MIPFYEKLNENIRVFHSIGLNFPLHLHSQLEMVYVLENEIKMTINNNKKVFKKGDFIIIFPNIIHSYDTQLSQESPLNTALTVICGLMLTGEHMNKLINYHAHDSFVLKENLHEDVAFAMHALFKEMDEVKNLSACKAFIQLILARILPELNLINNKDSDFHGLIYQLVNYISQNFRDYLSLDSIADELGVSKYYLSRIFSNKLNTNFNDYINGVRLNYATMLMSTTDHTITQICNDSGFNSQRTFNRVFQETFQVTPREYRYRDKEKLYNITNKGVLQ